MMQGAWASAAAVSGLLLAPLGAHAETRPWVQAKSPNFTVVSDAGIPEARRIAARFEQVREVFRGLWPRARLGTGEPIVILAARDEASLRRLLPEFYERKGAKRVSGVFFRSSERQYVALRADVGDEHQGMNPYHVLYHEYVHALLDLNFERMPIWLGEGLADFFGNTIVRDDAITQGRPIARYVQLLRERGTMPLPVLLKVDHESPEYNEDTRASVLYAQSWALVHFLLTDETGNGPRQINTFLALLGQGLPAEDAQVRAFGDLKRLEKDLGDYIRQYAFRYAVRKGDFAPRAAAIAARELAPAESLAERGGFLGLHGPTAQAAALLDEALSLDPGLALVHESRGLLAWREGRRDDARAAFEKAAALGSKSAVAHYLNGVLLLEGVVDRNSLDAAAAAFQRAVDLNHDSAPAYAMLAQTLAETGAPPERTLPLARRAVRLEPNVAQHHFVVARILLDAGRIDEAEKEIGLALGVARDERERNYARELQSVASRRRDAAPGQAAGVLVPDPDPATAARILSARCEGGEVQACAGLGALRLEGKGLPRDEAAAAAPLQKACEGGDAWSCSTLGWMYDGGRGVPRDRARAVALVARACAAGRKESCLMEANALADGSGVARDPERARRLFEAACDEGLAAGCSGLGVLELRRGTGANFRRAAGLFTRGCDGGDPAGCANLAALQAAGLGVAKNAAESARNYRKACEDGYSPACSRAAAN
jgi:TPR repeat protein